METPKLNTLKKELLKLPAQELVNCLTRLAKYKVENKELLNFLLFYQENTDDYITEIKQIIEDAFDGLPTSDYLKIKVLRKAIRIMNKHLKFVAEKKQDTELLLFFCQIFIEKRVYRTKLRALQNLFIRQFMRLQKSIDKLEEDLQFDYGRELEELLKKIRKNKISLE